MVLLDGEQMDETGRYSATISDNLVIVNFNAGTEQIEIVGTYVISESDIIEKEQQSKQAEQAEQAEQQAKIAQLEAEKETQQAKIAQLEAEKQEAKIAQLEAEKETQQAKITQLEAEQNGGGCLIATATYGSELAPQVQQLRELRDNQLLQTESGTAFMGTFNDIYYSFSPMIADYERENPLFKEAVNLAITPMISTLSLMENANSESEVLSIGLSVIALNLGMYLGVPAIVVVGIRKMTHIN
jgi:G3E family GTPase